jgi:type II secretory pathway component PulK
MAYIKLNPGKKGTSVLFMVGAIAVLTILCTSLLTTSMQGFRTSVKMKESLQAIHLAKAGIVLAREKLKTDTEYKKESLVKLAKGEMEIRVEIINEKKVIVSTGYFPGKHNMRQMKILKEYFE